MSSISELEQLLIFCLMDASSATSGGEGLARMGSVRDTQIKLAYTYKKVATDISLSNRDTKMLEKSRDLYIEVLSSWHGVYHASSLDSLIEVLTLLNQSIADVCFTLAEVQLKELKIKITRGKSQAELQDEWQFVNILALKSNDPEFLIIGLNNLAS